MINRLRCATRMYEHESSPSGEVEWQHDPLLHVDIPHSMASVTITLKQTKKAFTVFQRKENDTSKLHSLLSSTYSFQKVTAVVRTRVQVICTRSKTIDMCYPSRGLTQENEKKSDTRTRSSLSRKDIVVSVQLCWLRKSPGKF